MVSEADSIVYVPRDRRKTVDHKYLEAQHFHNLLLVSKTFIKANEFAFALLGTASLTFYSYNELRRLITEIEPAFKNCVRRIHFVRTWTGQPYARWKEPLDGFINISETLSTSFPELRKIYLSLPAWCGNLGFYYNRAPPTQEELSALLECVLCPKDSRLEVPQHFRPRVNAASLVAAGFVANRNTRRLEYAFTRPQAWVRRLILFAEESNIEVIFKMQLCITNSCDVNAAVSGSYGEPSHKVCFSNTARYPYHGERNSGYWLIHIVGEMSTKDWMLRVKHEDREYAVHQQIGYEMIHAPVSKGSGWWQALLRDIRQR